jgi:hypothetical protein
MLPVPAIYLTQRRREFLVGIAHRAGDIALGEIQDGPLAR